MRWRWLTHQQMENRLETRNPAQTIFYYTNHWVVDVLCCLDETMRKLSPTQLWMDAIALVRNDVILCMRTGKKKYRRLNAIYRSVVTREAGGTFVAVAVFHARKNELAFVCFSFVRLIGATSETHAKCIESDRNGRNEANNNLSLFLSFVVRHHRRRRRHHCHTRMGIIAYHIGTDNEQQQKNGKH